MTAHKPCLSARAWPRTQWGAGTGHSYNLHIKRVDNCPEFFHCTTHPENHCVISTGHTWALFCFPGYWFDPRHRVVIRHPNSLSASSATQLPSVLSSTILCDHKTE